MVSAGTIMVMKYTDFIRFNPQLNSNDAYLERLFLDKVFFPEFGENGLDHLSYQYRILDQRSNRFFYIDFVVWGTGNRKYAIELDGRTYHTNMSSDRFDREENRTNEVTRQGFELIRYSYNQVNSNPYGIRQELRNRIYIPLPRISQQKGTVNQNTQPVTAPAYKKEKSGGCGKIFLAFLILFSLSILFPSILDGCSSSNTKKNYTHSQPITRTVGPVSPTKTPITRKTAVPAKTATPAAIKTALPGRIVAPAPTRTPVPQPVQNRNYLGSSVTWHCVDATSYDGNAYNDNKCTSSTGEVRFVSDSESKKLDPTYTPGKAGHPYYNSR